MANSEKTRGGGRTLDGLARSLARKGLDFLDITGVTVVGNYHHGSRHVVEGIVRDTLEENLGTSTYKEICNQFTVLENIHYCQSGLSFMDGFHHPQKVIPIPGSSASLGDAVALPSLINHDYLVLELHYSATANTSSSDHESSLPPPPPQHQLDQKLFVRAEKAGHPSENAGILITLNPNYEAMEQFVRLFTIHCGAKEIALNDLQCILADHNPEYSLRDQNCWQYTRRTAKRVLIWCEELPGLSDEELRRLRREEDTIEARIAKKHLQSVVKSGKKGLRSVMKMFG